MPEATKGRAKVVCSRKASAAASEESHPRARTTNWSPPSRPTTSPGRTCSASRAATWHSSASPTSCPSESLTVLKPSRSSTSRPVASAPLRRSASASEIERSREDRFGRPVSSSWAACQARACSLRTRAVMSVCVTTTWRGPDHARGLQPEPGGLLAQPAGVVVVERRRPGLAAPSPADSCDEAAHRRLDHGVVGRVQPDLHGLEVVVPHAAGLVPVAPEHLAVRVPGPVGGEDAAGVVDQHGRRRERLQDVGELDAPPRRAR